MTPPRILPIALLSLLTAADPVPAAGQHPAKEKPKPSKDIEVTIKFSVKELDPKKPGDSYLECTVRNKTDKAIRVPTVYTYGFDTEMLLHAKSEDRWPLRMFSTDREKKEQKHQLLGPGKEITVFKAPLKELLKLTSEAPKNRTVEWSWQA